MKRTLIFVLALSLLLAAPASASACALLMQLPALCGFGSESTQGALSPCHMANAPAPEKLKVEALPENCCAVSSAPQSEVELMPSKAKSISKVPVSGLIADTQQQAQSFYVEFGSSHAKGLSHDQQALLCVFLS